MSDRHLMEGESERFARGELAGGRIQELVRHLVRGCALCEERLRPLLVGKAVAGETPDHEYDAAITRAYAAALSKDPRVVPGDQSLAAWGLGLIRSRSGETMDLTEEEALELKGVPMLETLLRLSFAERYRNPRKMVILALCARVAAENIDVERYGPRVKADYRALAWAELGNAYRVAEQLDEADHALDRAEELLPEGTGNLILLARLLDLRASYMAARRYLSEACQLLEAAQGLYDKLGDDHLAGRVLVKQGIYTDYGGDSPRALGLLSQGLARLDRDRDPQLYTTTCENVLRTMTFCGRFHEAAAFLMKSGLREALAGEPMSLLKLRWVEGQILAGLGKPRRAAGAFEEARAGFLSHDQGYKAALVGLDLAEIWLAQGKHAKVRELALEMVATFRRLYISREGVRAAEYLRWACDRERLDLRLLRHVSGFLQRLEREPQLFFQTL